MRIDHLALFSIIISAIQVLAIPIELVPRSSDSCNKDNAIRCALGFGVTSLSCTKALLGLLGEESVIDFWSAGPCAAGLSNLLANPPKTCHPCTNRLTALIKRVSSSEGQSPAPRKITENQKKLSPHASSTGGPQTKSSIPSEIHRITRFVKSTASSSKKQSSDPIGSLVSKIRHVL